MFIARGVVVAVCHLEVSVALCIQDSAAACQHVEEEVVVKFHEAVAVARKNQQKATIAILLEPEEMRNWYS